jgi:hypothetical protein
MLADRAVIMADRTAEDLPLDSSHWPFCPIIVAKESDDHWPLCNKTAIYLVQGTMLCGDHATQSDIQPTHVCTQDSHVIRPGQHRCLCSEGEKG